MTRAVLGPGKAAEVLPSGLLVGIGQVVGIVVAIAIGTGGVPHAAWARVALAALAAGAGLGLQQRPEAAVARRPAGRGVVRMGRGVVWSPTAAGATATGTAGLTLLLADHAHGGLAALAFVLVALPGVASVVGAVLRVPATVAESMVGAEVEHQVLLETSAVTLAVVVGGATLAGLAQAFGVLGPVNLLVVLALGGAVWVLAGAAIRRRRF